jgi:hypothetical protein
MINPSLQNTNSPQQGPRDISTAKVEEHVQVQGNSDEGTQESTSGLVPAIETWVCGPPSAHLVRLLRLQNYLLLRCT